MIEKLQLGVSVMKMEMEKERQTEPRASLEIGK